MVASYTLSLMIRRGKSVLRGVAQLGSASVLGAEGPRFKSGRPDKKTNGLGKYARKYSVNPLPSSEKRARSRKIWYNVAHGKYPTTSQDYL